MTKSDTNLSPDKKGESEKKNLVEDIELIEFNVKTPKVFYDFFSAVINLLDWKYNHVIDYFEDVLVNSLVSQMYCDKSLVLPDNLLKKFDNISESFINEKKGEKK